METLILILKIYLALGLLSALTQIIIVLKYRNIGFSNNLKSVVTTGLFWPHRLFLVLQYYIEKNIK